MAQVYYVYACFSSLYLLRKKFGIRTELWKIQYRIICFRAVLISIGLFWGPLNTQCKIANFILIVFRQKRKSAKCNLLQDQSLQAFQYLDSIVRTFSFVILGTPNFLHWDHDSMITKYTMKFIFYRCTTSLSGTLLLAALAKALALADWAKNNRIPKLKSERRYSTEELCYRSSHLKLQLSPFATYFVSGMWWNCSSKYGV